MILTQERINEIALEVAKYMPQGFLWWEDCGWQAGILDEEIISFVNLFLSRIREEQEAVAEVKEGHLANWLQWNSEELMSITPIGTKLFTIPPAAPECNCKELGEALEKIIEAEWMVTHYWGGDRQSVLKQAGEALAKHKASMGEKG